MSLIIFRQLIVTTKQPDEYFSFNFYTKKFGIVIFSVLSLH